MIAICRNERCPKFGREYQAGNQQGTFPGYCTKKCATDTAKRIGWSESRERKGGLTVEQTLRTKGLWGRMKKLRVQMPAIDEVLTPLGEQPPQGESQAMVAYSPAAMDVLGKFQETTLSFELHAPDDPRILELLADPDKPLADARQMSVGSDAEYRIADMTRIRLLDEADEIEAGRTSGTQPMGAVKNGWDGIWMPGVKGRKAAAEELARKMREREKAVRQEEDAKKELEEAQLRRDREKVLRAADKEAERRRRLKDPTLVEDSLRKEEELKAIATSMPEALTRTAMSAPLTGGSNRAERWVGRVTDVPMALRWILVSAEKDHPEWLEMISFKQGVLNTLAKFVKDTREVPGFEFENETGFRRPKGR